MIEGEGNEIESEERKAVERNLSELIRNNVIDQQQENEDLPEAEGLLIDGSMLDKMNKSGFGEQTEEDILAGISESKSKRKGSKRDKSQRSKRSKRDKKKKERGKSKGKSERSKRSKRDKSKGKSQRSRKSKIKKDKKKKESKSKRSKSKKKKS